MVSGVAVCASRQSGTALGWKFLSVARYNVTDKTTKQTKEITTGYGKVQ